MIYQNRWRNLIFFTSLFFLLTNFGLASAEDFLFASNKDKNIRSLLSELLPVAEDQLQTWDTDIALVYHQRVYEAQENNYDFYDNYVWWVRDGEAPDITNFVKDFAPGVELKKVKAFVIHPGEFGVEAALNSEIIELDKKRIHIQKGNGKDKFTNLVVAFDSAQPGDLFGLSIKAKVKEPLYWEAWLIAEKTPVSRAELRVKCDWRLAFTVFGYRFEKGKMQQEILDTDKDHIKDMRIWADNIDPIISEPYSPSGFKQSSILAVALRAYRFEFEGLNLWWTIDHWNQVAARMSYSENEYRRENELAAEEAILLAGNLNEQDKAAAIYIFIRDELLEINSRNFIPGDDYPTVNDILEARAGSVTQKSCLFLAMLESVGLEARLAWVHDPHKGGFVVKYPNWNQLTEPLVKVTYKNGQESWFDLGCYSCSPGQIRPRLRNARAIVYDRDCTTKEDELIRKCSVEGYHYQKNPFNLYMTAVKREAWNKLFLIPGNPEANVAWLKESLKLEREKGEISTGTLEYRSWGINSLNEKMKSLTDAGPFIKKKAKRRFPEMWKMEIGEELTVQNDTAAVALILEDVIWPDPMGDTWILPGELVFGKPTHDVWPEIRQTSIVVEQSTEREWEIRIPLPEQWEGVELPEDKFFGVDILQYMVTYRQEDTDIVVRRFMMERTGFIEEASLLKTVGTEMEKIHLLETSPLVLRRSGE